LNITLVGKTEFDNFAASKATGWTPNNEPVESADQIAEFGGRLCYQAWERKNPKTATNRGYIDNIIDHGHESVLEHGTFNFYVEGVSRSLLTELERHRHLSFSVISQRFVGPEHIRFVVPPAIRDYMRDRHPEWTDEQIEADWQHQPIFNYVFEAYDDITFGLTDETQVRGKKLREAARSVLPNCTEVKMLVSGNVRAWRHVIKMRFSEHADAEIREFAEQILWVLRREAPNSVQDIAEVPSA
jgi:thymidylate synthase (FAD)